MKKLFKIGFLLFLLFTGFIKPTEAQIRFAPWSQNYVVVTSYLGVETQERFNSFKFELNGIGIDKKNWSLSVRLISPITIVEVGPNRSGKVFPADKLSLRWTTDSNNPHTNLNTIGASRNEIMLQNSSEVMLIDRSQAPLNSYGSYYSEFTLFSTLKVASGKYLDDFLSGRDQYTHIKYKVPVVFTLYDEHRNVIAAQPIDFDLHLHPTLTDGGLVDVEPDYSLVIGAAAADATLAFLTEEDYNEGVSLSFDNAVKINASTDFEVRVKSLDPTFLRNGGNTLPLSMLSLQLTPGQGAASVVSNPTLVLSDTEQVALSGTSTDKKIAQYFHLNYKAKLTPTQVLSSTLGTYSVSLLYLLMPR